MSLNLLYPVHSAIAMDIPSSTQKPRVAGQLEKANYRVLQNMRLYAFCYFLLEVAFISVCRVYLRYFHSACFTKIR